MTNQVRKTMVNWHIYYWTKTGLKRVTKVRARTITYARNKFLRTHPGYRIRIP